ncbi:MAG TPA: ferrous iron transporter B, partial [Anaerolineae bacterium]
FANWMSDGLLTPVSDLLTNLLSWAPAWASGFLVDGLIGGVGTVLTFLPILVVFFAVLGTLEDVGYLARAAYVMDRFMHLMGLHGKSFMPLFLGFGCNVPAVLGSRIVEEKRTRLLTIILAPLVPCTARLAVIAFLAPAFFGAALAAPVSWLLVAINLVVLAVVGVVYNRIVFAGKHTAFIMEMPLYHAPNLRSVGLYVWSNTISFLKKAGSLILIASAVIWLLSNVPGGGPDRSVLAFLGRGLEPAGRVLGLGDWRLITALIASFVAKENVIATLGILYGGAAGTALATQVATNLIPAARLAFLVVTMLFVPCLATTATMRQETGSWRWPALSIALLLALSLGAGAITYQAFGLMTAFR